jgi:hypothetical protein
MLYRGHCSFIINTLEPHATPPGRGKIKKGKRIDFTGCQGHTIVFGTLKIGKITMIHIVKYLLIYSTLFCIVLSFGYIFAS